MFTARTSTRLLRDKFTDESLTTASPARVVVMAYERLDRDLAGALEALERRDIERSNRLLGHAQDLVAELRAMLDLDRWEHAPALASIYVFVNELLATANVHKRPAEVVTARALLAELGGAFAQAATPTVDTAGTPFGDPAGTDPSPSGGRISVRA